MKKNLVVVLMCVSAYFSIVVTSYAACSGDRCTDAEVTRLYIRPEGDVLIDTDGDEKDLSGCTPSEQRYIYLKNDHKNKKEIYAALLSAQLAGKKVWIRVDENQSPCQVDYVVLDKQ
jgi:hypothetical protein